MRNKISAGLLALLVLTGCSSPDPTRKDLATAERLAADPSLPEDLRPYYQRLYWEGESNATLNRMRLASAAIENSHWPHAERALNEAIRDLEALGPADERSRKALSEFHAEEIKKFKGEPYERAMAYFLRGLLYLREKDWSNARACFKSVQIQTPVRGAEVGDSKIENRENRPEHGEESKIQNPKSKNGSPSWAAADWLEGWCARQLGETAEARDGWRRAQSAGLPAPSDSDSVVSVALLGWGPVKVPGGKQGERLAYRRGASRANQVRARTGSALWSFNLTDDLFAHATGRGLRHMDVVNQQKAETKEGVQTAGEILTVGGAGAVIGGAVEGDTTVAAAGLGAAAAGMATQGVASAMQPKADTRGWDLLPARIALLSLTPPSGAGEMVFQFLDEKGALIREQKIALPGGSQPELILLTER